MAENTEAGNLGDSSNLGRNEPCHCGSGKKFKRCHGVNAAPKLSPPKAWGAPGGEGGAGAGAAGSPGFPGGFDPSQLDPQMMMQFTQALQRLPKGQLQRLQGIMQRAMSGQDVTRDAEAFERTLPVDVQELMKNFGAQMAQMQMMSGMAPGGLPGGIPGVAGDAQGALPDLGQADSATDDASASGMTEEQAREIVAAAAKEGRISREEAEKLLAASSGGSTQTEEEKKKGFANFWRGVTGKND